MTKGSSIHSHSGTVSPSSNRKQQLESPAEAELLLPLSTGPPRGAEGARDRGSLKNHTEPATVHTKSTFF